MVARPPTERGAPLIYSLDRRGPNDPRLGSIHAFIGVLVVGLLAAMYLVL